MSPVAGARVAWAREVAGALNATAALLPFVLSYGFIAYGALGDAAARVGLTASLVAVVFGAAVMVVFSRARLPSASPSASASLIVGGTVIALLRDPRLAPGTADGLALLLAATAAMVVGSGLLMIGLGLAGAGRLVRYVPRPVLAGFMNGVAILIVVSQLPPLLGLPAGAWAHDGLRSLATWQGPALGVALSTALLMVAIRWRWPKAPASLLALVLAGIVVSAWQAHAAPGSAAAGLQRVGTLALSLPHVDTLAPWLDRASWPVLAPHLPTLANTTLVLALIGAMESALNLSAVDETTHDRTDVDRELVAVGAANIASGLLGGLPLVYLRLRALSNWAGGGRSARAVLLDCTLVALGVTLAAPWLEQLSTAVIAGIVVVLAWALADVWTHQLVRQWRTGQRSGELRWNLVVVAVVCMVTLGWGFVAGVLAGVVVAVWMFVRVMNRQLVRARYSAARMPSRRVYAAADEPRLALLRERIVVYELEGALFFGSAERLLDEAARLPAGTETLIVDLRRVSTVDASGALTLVRLARHLDLQGIVLRLSGLQVADRHGQALAAHGVSLAAPGGTAQGLLVHPDLDRAVEAAERAALGRCAAGAGGMAAVPLARCQIFDGLDPAQAACLASHLRARSLAAGERLFAQGDPGRALYVLTAGSVSVVDAQHGQRFVSFSPGMCFGETALLDGGGRTADAVADVDSVVHELDLEAFVLLQQAEPALAAQVYRNIATHLSQRLRAAAAAWRHAAA